MEISEPRAPTGLTDPPNKPRRLVVLVHRFPCEALQRNPCGYDEDEMRCQDVSATLALFLTHDYQSEQGKALAAYGQDFVRALYSRTFFRCCAQKML